MARILLADQSPVARGWLRLALRNMAHDVEEASTGWELLWHLAEDEPFDLVIASERLRGIPGSQVLAMARTAGAPVPFIIIDSFAKDAVRHLIDRVPDAELVDDPLDAVQLRTKARFLLGTPRQTAPNMFRRDVLRRLRLMPEV